MTTSTITTPLMSLVLPTPSVQIGPTWAQNINAALELLDSHDHTTGKGSKIPTSALNVNAVLNMAAFDVINLRSTRFKNNTVAFGAVEDKSCLYVLNGELYFRDEVGNNVKMTAAGSVNTSSAGYISGMGGTTASVVYVDASKRFAFNQNTGILANVNTGPLSIYDPILNGKFAKFQVPSGLSASYTMTLPTALPASEYPLFMNASGSLSPRAIAAGDINFGIGPSNISNGAITDEKVSANDGLGGGINGSKIWDASIVGSSIAPTTIDPASLMGFTKVTPVAAVTGSKNFYGSSAQDLFGYLTMPGTPGVTGTLRPIEIAFYTGDFVFYQTDPTAYLELSYYVSIGGVESLLTTQRYQAPAVGSNRIPASMFKTIYMSASPFSEVKVRIFLYVGSGNGHTTQWNNLLAIVREI